MTSRRVLAVACGVQLLLALSCLPIETGRSVPPDRLDDAAFWRLHTGLSEPGGTFRSDNLVSNERGLPEVLPEVARRASAAAAYIGVGPEQNFSYISALAPRVAFIVDIRRDNAMLHLLYKALFELSTTRAEFVSRLFSRPLSKHLRAESSANDLLEAAAVGKPSRESFAANLAEVHATLLGRHRWPVNDVDLAAIAGIYEAFFAAGPGISYSFGSRRGGQPFPTYAELMTAGNALTGSYLSSEAAYRRVRELQLRNLVVPVVGDFSGSRALVGVGAFLREYGLTVAVFYASNVEMYLFRSEGWKRFYSNVSSLPIGTRSILVRSVFSGFGRGFFGGGIGTPGGGASPPGAWPGMRGGGPSGVLWTDPIESLLADVARGDVSTYGELLARMR
jgi:hypothetical protein